jgi:hypothetical protein
MPKILWFVALALCCSTVAPAQQVSIEYDESYDFSEVRTFAWKASEETSVVASDPLAHSRIVNSIEHHLTQAGLVEVEKGADVQVTYHVAVEERTHVDTTTFGYEYGDGWYSGGDDMVTSTTRQQSYDYGTLIVDVWDSATKHLVWRGSAGGALMTDPEKRGRQIERALRKMVNRWRKLKPR